jgi:hypothetical protein
VSITVIMFSLSRFDSEAFGLKLSAWGEHRLVERRIVRGSPKAEIPDLIEFGVAADGRIAQVVAMNHTIDDATLSDFVRRRVEVNGNADALMEPGVRLETLLT